MTTWRAAALLALPITTIAAIAFAGDSAPAPTSAVPDAVTPPRGALGTFVRGPSALVAGTPAALRIATHWSTSETVSGPEANVAVTVTLAGAGGRRAPLWSGTTDRQGIADARFTVPRWPDGKYTLTVESRARGRGDVHTHEVQLGAGGKLLLQSDKPLYQPAQTIHLRAVAVRPQDGRPMTGHEVTFAVADPKGNVVFRQARPLSRFGVAACDFPLADEISLGRYTVTASLPDELAPPAELGLPVERYTLPKFDLKVSTDKGWLTPADPVTVTVDARYFFGKPVAGAPVRVDSSLRVGRGPRVTTRHATKTDADGRARLVLERQTLGGEPEGTLRLDVEVTDGAAHTERATKEVTVSRDPLRVELTAEVPRLVPGASNRLFVAVSRPDGTPVEEARVTLRSDGGVTVDGPQRTTDAVGLATFEARTTTSTPSARCPRGEQELAFRVTSAEAAFDGTRCLGIATAGALRVRPDRALYPAGAALTVDVDGLGPDGDGYLDVVKDGQLVDTARLRFVKGHARALLPADERRFGTLELTAYRIAGDGAVSRGARLVYVERPSALKLEARLEPASGDPSATFRPGESGRLHLRVLDAQTGRGTEAQVAAVMVDKSLLALRSVTPGASRVYFQLAAAASRASERLRVRPGNYSVDKILESDGFARDALKDAAATVLLAGAQPPWELGWLVDPWRERVEAHGRLVGRLADAANKFVPSHLVGERVPGGGPRAWRWRHDLVDEMARAGAIPSRDARDPWGRRVAAASVVERAGLGEFNPWAEQQVAERLSTIYRAIAKVDLAKQLPVDAELPGKKGVVVLARADLDKLVATSQLPAWALVDPWGRPFRIAVEKRPWRVGLLRSRFILASDGADGVAGTKDDLYPIDRWWGTRPADIQLGAVGLAEARGTGLRSGGGFGLSGVGYGGGGASFGSAFGAGGLGTIGRGGGGGGDAPRVRREFPETMLWRPDLVTDANGEATLPVTMADSITTWQLGLEAISADGRIGQLTTDVRVFQDFFADVDLPPIVTQHDELSVPVSVYNYLPTSQKVTLTVKDAPWFTLAGPRTETLELAPSQVGVRYFRIAVRGTGRGALTVEARGQSMADAVERSLTIRPDGVERALSFQDRVDGAAPARHALSIPADALADASVAQLKVYPSSATHVIEGLDSMLRMPHGCFEQTSSTTYPNALILDYLRQSGKATPDVEKKAKEYLALGYQRLLTFEVAGGGFSWFGDAPANKILTAYGLEEFFDMARVHPVDPRVIARTQRWLASQQREDGSWAPDTRFINEGATNRFNSDAVRITAYVALALQRTGHRGPEVGRAVAYVRDHLRDDADAYTVSLAAELLQRAGEARGGEARDRALDALLDRLWGARTDQPDGKTTAFEVKDKTPTYGSGKSAVVETTARAASALGRGRAPAARVDRALGYLLGAKDTFGNWHSTQATILALKALLESAGQRQKGRGTLRVRVDGTEVAALEVDLASDLLSSVELPQLVRAGKHDVELAWQGPSRVAYQLVGRWWEPQPRAGAVAPAAAGDLTVTASLDRGRVAVGETVVEKLHAEARAAIDMPIVTAGLPPGFDLDPDELERITRASDGPKVDKVQRTPDGLVLYLSRLEPSKPLDLALRLRPRFPVDVQIPAPTAYPYYEPERRVAGTTLRVTAL